VVQTLYVIAPMTAAVLSEMIQDTLCV